jgi:diguanylate cyclase (GGDEF)-like protein
LDVRKLPVDAIAASDDETAFGVITELKDRNFSVPVDIAVTGFDDDIISETSIPSITTARQDFPGIGRISADTLFRKLSGDQVDEANYVASVLVTRQSCGCMEREFCYTQMQFDNDLLEEGTLLSFVSSKLIPLFKRDVPEQQIIQWAAALVKKMGEVPFSKDGFLYLLDQILVDHNHRYSKEPSVWQEALILLARGVEIHNDEFECVHAVLSTLIFAATLVQGIQHKEERKNEFVQNDSRLHLRRITSALVLAFDIDSLAEELFKSLPELSLNTALVGLYHTPIKSSESNADRTIDTLIGFDGDGKINIRHNSWNPILFSDYSTIDDFDFERERRTLFFLPLFFKEDEVGIMLLPYSPEIPADTYETLRINISATVKGAELLSKIQTLSITDELTGLLNRRGFFQFVYTMLRHLNRNSEAVPIVMFMDMDGLKHINDTYGHKEGDVAISAFAKVLKETVREEDIVGRMGGDEFIVFSSVKSSENSKQLEERIRAKLDDYNSKGFHPYSVAGSIGSVILGAATKECFEAAMLSADSVLYEEKMKKKEKGLSRQ